MPRIGSESGTVYENKMITIEYDSQNFAHDAISHQSLFSEFISLLLTHLLHSPSPNVFVLCNYSFYFHTLSENI